MLMLQFSLCICEQSVMTATVSGLISFKKTRQHIKKSRIPLWEPCLMGVPLQLAGLRTHVMHVHCFSGTYGA